MAATFVRSFGGLRSALVNSTGTLGRIQAQSPRAMSRGFSLCKSVTAVGGPLSRVSASLTRTLATQSGGSFSELHCLCFRKKQKLCQFFVILIAYIYINLISLRWGRSKYSLWINVKYLI